MIGITRKIGVFVHLRSFTFGALITSLCWYIILTLLHRQQSTTSRTFSISPPTSAIFCPEGTNPLSNVFHGLSSITPKNQLVIDVGAFDGTSKFRYIFFCVSTHTRTR